jgi:hypothetical protein
MGSGIGRDSTLRLALGVDSGCPQDAPSIGIRNSCRCSLFRELETERKYRTYRKLRGMMWFLYRELKARCARDRVLSERVNGGRNVGVVPMCRPDGFRSTLNRKRKPVRG